MTLPGCPPEPMERSVRIWRTTLRLKHMKPLQLEPWAIAVCLQLLVACSSNEGPRDSSSAQPADTIPADEAPIDTVEQVPNGPPNIQGRWWLGEGKGRLALDFDTVPWLMTTKGIPPIPFRLDGDSIIVYEEHHGELSTGRIWRLTHQELGIRWTTGDSNVYRR